MVSGSPPGISDESGRKVNRPFDREVDAARELRSALAAERDSETFGAMAIRIASMPVAATELTDSACLKLAEQGWQLAPEITDSC